MSGLKAFELKVGKNLETDSPLVVGVDDRWRSRVMSYEKVYLKSEADKVIAEKDNEISELKELVEVLKHQACKMDCMTVKLYNEACDDLIHQKYKRCLAMAECRDAQARLFHRFGTEVMLHQLYGRNPAVDMKRMDRRSSRCRLASQLWKKRAEEFKEAK